MGRACTICSHDNRPGIELALAQRTPYRKIAERFGVSVTSLRRHKLNHVPVGEMLSFANLPASQHAPARGTDARLRAGVRGDLQARIDEAAREVEDLGARIDRLHGHRQAQKNEPVIHITGGDPVRPAGWDDPDPNNPYNPANIERRRKEDEERLAERREKDRKEVAMLNDPAYRGLAPRHGEPEWGAQGGASTPLPGVGVRTGGAPS
jgi:hypothetical protein